MSLADYRRKRRFDRTPEPHGKSKQRAGACVSSCRSTTRAPALRLPARARRRAQELGGAQGAVARPGRQTAGREGRGPSARLRSLRGTIPTGNYGAGGVIVWDEGTYHAVEGGDAGDLRRGLASGRLSVVLHGHKLKENSLSSARVYRAARRQELAADQEARRLGVREGRHRRQPLGAERTSPQWLGQNTAATGPVGGPCRQTYGRCLRLWSSSRSTATAGCSRSSGTAIAPLPKSPGRR